MIRKEIRIRITGTPPGIAPHAIQDGWVGLVLPALDAESGGRGGHWTNTFLPPPRDSPWKLRDYLRWLAAYRLIDGYAVSSLEALTVLEENRPEIARWWWEHAPRWYFLPTARLVFPKQCAEVVPTDYSAEASRP